MTTLSQVVTEELTKMMARQLDYAPAAEDLPYTIAIMTGDLQRKGLTDDDELRVREAFGNVAINAVRWPTTYMVLEHMPGRAPAYPALEGPPPKGILTQLKKVGLEQKIGESAAEYAVRCRQWMMANQSSLAVPKHITAQFDEWPDD